MRRLAPSAMAALLLAALPGALEAQAATAPAPAAKPTPPTKEEVEQAAFELRVLINAMQSDKVEAPAKDALFQCLYNHNFASISDAVDKVIAANAGKVDKRNANQMLVVMAGVCGYRPQQAAAGGPPATRAPVPAPKAAAPAPRAAAPAPKAAAPAPRPATTGR